MKYITSIIIIFISLQIIAACSYAQQYEDVVYLKNGGIIHGIITEQIPGESIKIKTNDGNVFIFKMDEIEKMIKEEIVIKKEEIKKVETDSIKTKDVKTKLKKDSSKTKELTAKNSFTIQPIGLLTLLTNFEYDRALSGSFSMGLKLSFMTFFLREAVSFKGSPENVEDAEKQKESLSAWGIGSHIRIYPGGRAVEGFFIGIAAEKLTANFDEIKNKDGEPKTTTNRTVDLIRLELEIGDRIKLSNRQGGFTILWSLGAGVGFLNGIGDKGNESSTIPLGSIGFGMGYSF